MASIAYFQQKGKFSKYFYEREETKACHSNFTLDFLGLTFRGLRKTSSQNQQVALNNTLAEYFSAVNVCYLPSMIDPVLMTGLTNAMAEDISNNYQ